LAEISVTDDTLKTIQNHSFFRETKFSDCHQSILTDGTMIRVFWHDGEWHKATNRCIDANKASWGPVKSFGYLFDETAEYVGLDYSKLNKENSYTFIMKHPVNRIIEPVTSFPMLFHTDTIHTITGKSIIHDISIKNCPQVNYNSIDEMINHLLDPETPWCFQGFLLTNSRNERLKLENPQYSHVFNIKGNVITETGTWKLRENIDTFSYRLFQIIQSGKESEFIQYFSEHIQTIINIKERMFKLSEHVWETYKQRFIFKNTDYHQDPEIQTFLNFLHYTYHTTHKPITQSKCLESIKKCPTIKLMKTLDYIEYKQKAE